MASSDDPTVGACVWPACLNSPFHLPEVYSLGPDQGQCCLLHSNEFLGFPYPSFSSPPPPPPPNLSLAPLSMWLGFRLFLITLKYDKLMMSCMMSGCCCCSAEDYIYSYFFDLNVPSTAKRHLRLKKKFDIKIFI